MVAGIYDILHIHSNGGDAKLKLISWNVNGLRACLNKGFLQFVESAGADVLALQETKMQQGQAEVDLPQYSEYWNSAQKKGYSGTAVFTRTQPLCSTTGIGMEEHDTEGRVITLEYPSFYFINCYTPNSQDGLRRLSYRMQWEEDFRAYLMGLDAVKPIVLCGDLNVAHQEIDIKNARTNRTNAGFTDEERAKMTALLSSGFADTFRRLYPDAKGAYSWWSYFGHARENNAGWRIDYFIVSDRLMPRVKDSFILPEVQGSDHCPVGIILEDDEA